MVAAATACDFERLAELARAGSFTHSFGDGDDAAAFWRKTELDGEPLGTLVQFLNRPFATRPAGDVTQYVWPRAYAYESWAAVPREAREELRPAYGTEDSKRFERFGSYNGSASESLPMATGSSSSPETERRRLDADHHSQDSSKRTSTTCS